MQELLILSYHDISIKEKSDSSSPESFYTISAKSFENQLDIIEKSGISIAEPNSLFQPNNSKTPSIILTFDDGFESHYKIVQPILEKRRIKALFFPITSTISSPGKLTWKDLENLAFSGHKIGSHSHTHKNYNSLNNEEIQEDVAISLRELSKKLQKQIELFAFPFGSHSTRAIKVLEKAGLKKVFTTKGIPNPSKANFTLHRVNINHKISNTDFERIIRRDKTYFQKRKRHITYQSVLRTVFGQKVENVIKQRFLNRKNDK